jgi:sugar lactone lactonase YvrE
MMKRVVLLAIAGVAVYLSVAPVPIEPLAWQAAPSLGYTGAHAVNSRLAGLTMIDLGDESGPEHIAIGPDNKLYTTVLSGNILRMNLDGTGREVFANTGGRVLGFTFDAAGNLIGADAIKGLVSISPKGDVTTLTDTVDGDPIRYADAVIVARDGRMYFSDASTRFAPGDWGGTFAASFFDVLEQSSTGRILEYDPVSKQTRTLAHGLSFANGVALTADEKHLLVNETGKYRVWKLAISAQKLDLLNTTAPPEQAQVVLDNLPGYPDNLMRGREGRIWLGFAKPRNDLIDRLASWPALRKMVLRLPKALWPKLPSYGHVLAIDESGKVLLDLQDPTGAYPETTSITETADRLYVHSLHAHSLGWLAASAVK